MDDFKPAWEAYWRDRSDANRNVLIEHYLPYVASIAEFLWHKVWANHDLDSLKSFGIDGLIEAIERFEPERGFMFGTFAHPRVRGAMLDGIRADDWMPRLTRQRQTQYKKVERQLTRQLGREPHDEEMATGLGIAFEELSKYKPYLQVQIRTDYSHIGDSDKPRPRVLELIAAPLDPAAQWSQRQELFEFIFKGLTRQERRVLQLYYYEDKTMREVAEVLELTESRVSQIHTALLPQLREKFARMRRT